MKFNNALIKGTLVKRHKRFLAEVALESGEIVTAHCANPGSMIGLALAGLTVYLSPASSGKLSYKWELVEIEGRLVGINTFHPNNLVEEAINNKTIGELAPYNRYRREVRYGQNSRVDFLLEANNYPPCYLEVKNVHLKRGRLAEFPDSVTQRGTKHLHELANIARQGARAIILYIVQRGDCDGFKLAADIDPVYAKAAKLASSAGVERLCYYCDISLTNITVAYPLKIFDSALI